MTSTQTLTAPTIRRTRTRNVTDLVIAETTLSQRIDALMAGWHSVGTRSTDHAAYRSARTLFGTMRGRHGFKAVPSPILSAPSDNLKLKKGTTPAYGLTLQSYRSTLSDGKRVNACPNAGHCVSVCVLNNGNGRYVSVQRARDARTDFLSTDPIHALILIGAELRRAVRKHGAITFRPNVNSDLDWHAIIGDTFRTLPGVKSYGYSKRPEVLTRSALSVEAYSWGETSDETAVAAFLAAGGTVAAVTDRKPGDPIRQWHPTATVVDADATDEWMFTPGVIGDLSAKGDARRLIGGKSGFIRNVYGA